jgi:hypothetical protein
MTRKPIARLRTRAGSGVQFWVAVLALSGASVTPSLFCLGAGASLRPQALSCGKVSAIEIKSALGIAVGTTKVTTAGSSTTCTYTHSTMIVKVSGGFSPASFAADRKSFDSHGEPTKTVVGLGSSAFSSTIGVGAYSTNTIVVLKGATELLITAPQVSLGKVEGLAKTVLKTI